MSCTYVFTVSSYSLVPMYAENSHRKSTVSAKLSWSARIPLMKLISTSTASSLVLNQIQKHYLHYTTWSQNFSDINAINTPLRHTVLHLMLSVQSMSEGTVGCLDNGSLPSVCQCFVHTFSLSVATVWCLCCSSLLLVLQSVPVGTVNASITAVCRRCASVYVAAFHWWT